MMDKVILVVVACLLTGPVRECKEIRVSVPEGMTLKQCEDVAGTPVLLLQAKFPQFHIKDWRCVQDWQV